MKMYDSLKTINYAHGLMKELSEQDKDRFVTALKDLFEKKQVSEEGEYTTFLITEQDIDEVYEDTFSV